jgi:hypothetical protein
MATQFAFGKIVTDGLVLALDAADKNSYPGSGTTWRDLSGNGNTGTLTNGPTFNSANGGSIVFDGTNDYVTAPNNTLLDTQTLTMESWNYPASVFQNGFLFEKGAVNTQYSNFYNSDGTFYFRTIGLSSQDLTFYVPSYITVNTWNHIVCTYASGVKSIYLNTVLISQATAITGTIGTNSTGLYIGAYGPGSSYFFNGRIAVSRFYTTALNIQQILQNYNAQKSRFNL